MKAYKFYSDPGHGWLAVKRSELERLNILHLISSCSYQRGHTVYLEEDCDASIFCAKKKELGETLSFVEKFTNNSHPIRSYESFSK